jgi:hypothetical protein
MSTDSPKSSRDEGTMILAIIQMVAGPLAAAYVCFRGGRHTISIGPTFYGVEGQLSGLSVMLGLAFLTMAYAGWKLWQETQLGYRLSAILFGLQILQVIFDGFQFSFVCPLSLGLGWLFDGTGLGLYFTTAAGVSLRLGLGRIEETPYFSVNVCALAAFAYLLYQSRQSKAKTVQSAVQQAVAADDPAAGKSE